MKEEERKDLDDEIFIPLGGSGDYSKGSLKGLDFKKRRKSIIKYDNDLKYPDEKTLMKITCVDYTGASPKSLAQVAKTGTLSLTNYRLFFEGGLLKFLAGHASDRSIDFKDIQSVEKGKTTIFDVSLSLEITVKEPIPGLAAAASPVEEEKREDKKEDKKRRESKIFINPCLFIFSMPTEKKRDYWYDTICSILKADEQGKAQIMDNLTKKKEKNSKESDGKKIMKAQSHDQPDLLDLPIHASGSAGVANDNESNSPRSNTTLSASGGVVVPNSFILSALPINPLAVNFQKMRARTATATLRDHPQIQATRTNYALPTNKSFANDFKAVADQEANQSGPKRTARRESFSKDFVPHIIQKAASMETPSATSSLSTVSWRDGGSGGMTNPHADSSHGHAERDEPITLPIIREIKANGGSLGRSSSLKTSMGAERPPSPRRSEAKTLFAKSPPSPPTSSSNVVHRSESSSGIPPPILKHATRSPSALVISSDEADTSPPPHEQELLPLLQTSNQYIAFTQPFVDLIYFLQPLLSMSNPKMLLVGIMLILLLEQLFRFFNFTAVLAIISICVIFALKVYPLSLKSYDYSGVANSEGYVKCIHALQERINFLYWCRKNVLPSVQWGKTFQTIQWLIFFSVILYASFYVSSAILLSVLLLLIYLRNTVGKYLSHYSVHIVKKKQ